MDLIDDLRTDLALAIFVERRLDDRIDKREAKSLIGRVQIALTQLSERKNAVEEPFDLAVHTGVGL